MVKVKKFDRGKNLRRQSMMCNKNVIPENKNFQNHKYKSIFTGLTFKGSPVSKQEYERHYQEYVARCSG